jgi:hypothetical protein
MRRGKRPPLPLPEGELFERMSLQDMVGTWNRLVSLLVKMGSINGTMSSQVVGIEKCESGLMCRIV